MARPVAAAEQITVYLVDDEVEVRAQIQTALALHGLEVKIFTNGAAFLADYHPLTAPGCLLIDNSMLGMKGSEVLSAVAAMGNPPPIVLMARIDELIELPRVSPCQIRFLRKPFTADELIDKVVRALKQRRPTPPETYLRFAELRHELEIGREARAMRRSAVDTAQSELEFRQGLLRVLESAMTVGRAKCGNIRVFNPVRDGLEIRVQQGFDRTAMDTFAFVRVEPTPCGRAFKQSRQIAVPDLQNDRGFRPYASIVRRCGIQSMQATPIRVDGYTVAVLSTHFAGHTELPPVDLSAVEYHAQMAARLIAGHR